MAQKVRPVIVVAKEHAIADAACGRDWNSGNGCGCGACTIMRQRISARKLTITEVR